MNIHDRALTAAKVFKNSASDLIDIIDEVDKTSAFLEKGLTSTHAYCIGFLRLSEPDTCNFIPIARKSREVPEIKEAIKNDIIPVTKAKKITSVITQENKAHWLELAQTLPKRLLEKEVAKVNPKEAVPEKIKYISEDRLKLETSLSEENAKILNRAQELLSQKLKRHVTIKEVLGVVLKDFVDREDPVNKAKRAEKRKVQVPGPVEKEKIPYERYPVKQSLKHRVNLRDNAQCTHINQNGQRCLERKWLHVHHVIPISHGGQNELSNLKTLCSGHHKMLHDVH
jgi:5-methylcytosine-specific restriction endonuclease McrA